MIGSAAYYLSDLQGSSLVLLSHLSAGSFSVNCLESFLFFLLKGETEEGFDTTVEIYSEKIKEIANSWITYAQEGRSYDLLIENLGLLKSQIYRAGSSKDVFLIDVIFSVVKKKYLNSCWHTLPKYSDLSLDTWRPIITKPGFIRELWPSQHMLGHHDILKGKSAVIQMPTSAGKTKAAELIVRSSFLSGRANVALIVAPFRALCHEIREDLIKSFKGESVLVAEITDVLQDDSGIFELFEKPQSKILVLTPEKLLYILRQDSQLAEKIKLIIFDEGHQFDSGNRGITYELLLTSLRGLLAEGTQKILISAVISNADEIGKWLNGEENKVVDGENINPTYKTVGFASWVDSLGQIKFVNSINIDEEDFFVPRVLQMTELSKLARERKTGYFPDKNDGKSVALFLGLKLVGNGGVAIFCGDKRTPKTIAENLIDIFKRNYKGASPQDVSDPLEIQRLKNLISLNLGNSSISCMAAELGVFMHHSTIPRGIRIAVEHAMRDELIKLVICTSTLAQGVNLPIRYLIVTSIYQAGVKLKVRDFHNLIGRAGRAGKHTEGSILFADPELYDKRSSKSWKWNNIKKLMDPKNSEACSSTLLSIFDPFTRDNKKPISSIDVVEFLKSYLSNSLSLDDFLERVKGQLSEKEFKDADILGQSDWKISLLSSIQSFFMAHLDNSEIFNGYEAVRLGEQTLAYHLANDEEKENLKKLFIMIAQNIEKEAPTKEVRKSYSQTLLGLQQSQEIENWVNSNLNKLMTTEEDNDLLKILWPLMMKHIKNKALIKCNEYNLLFEATSFWIGGQSFAQILEFFKSNDIKMRWGEASFRDYTIDLIVDIFEEGLSYYGSVILGAVSNFIAVSAENHVDGDTKELIVGRSQILQKRLKYGLKTKEEISIFEAGFCDRIIANRVYRVIGSFSGGTEAAKSLIKDRLLSVQEVLDDMPAYYHSLLRSI